MEEQLQALVPLFRVEAKSIFKGIPPSFFGQKRVKELQNVQNLIFIIIIHPCKRTFKKKHFMKTASILQDLTFNENKPAISVLFESDFTKEIRIAFLQNQVMKEHKTAFPIVVEVFDGEIDFGVDGENLILKKGDIVTLDANVPHDLKALAESVVRLTLAKGDRVSRVKDVANQA